MTEDVCKFLEWDSRFFNKRIARVCSDRLTDPAAVDRWSRDNQIDCLYFLCPPDDDESVAAAEQYGFHLVDIRLELNRNIETGAITVQPIVREFNEADLLVLRSIAEKAYTDSRFFHDDHFSRWQVSALYAEWITKSCRGGAGAVFVADLNNEPAGFITCQLEPDSIGRIGLLGVSESARGAGLGVALVKESLQYFKTQRMKEVRVVTQGRNIAAQRLYQSAGFRSMAVNLWYHKWFE